MTIQRIPLLFKDVKHNSFPKMIMDIADVVGKRTAVSCLNIKYTAWKFFLSFSSVKRVLVFDATLGMDSIALSGHVKSVVSVSPNIATTKMLQARFTYEHSDNIEIVECVVDNLPFADRCFDLIVCRDVEMLLSFLDGDSAIEDVYRELDRVLSNVGSIFLGFNKRPVLGFFPPIVQNVTRSRCSVDLSILRFFRKNKYKIKDIIYCLPEQYYMDELISQRKRCDWFRCSQLLKMKVKNLIVKKMYPIGSPNVNYLFTKKKGVNNLSLFDLVLHEVLVQLNIEQPNILLERVLVGNPNTVLMLIKGLNFGYVVRLPMCKDSDARLENQYGVLTVLLSLGLLPNHQFPKVFRPFFVQKQKVFIEVMIDGVVLDEFHLLSKLAEEVAIDWLIHFHAATIDRRMMEQTDILNNLTAPITLLKGYSRNKIEMEILEKLNTYVEDKLSNDHQFFFVCMHGDYKIENMLFSEDHHIIKGVFDWDLARISGMPLVDLLYFLAYTEKLRGSNLSIPEILLDKFIGESMSEWEREQVNKYMDFFNMSITTLNYYAIIACLFHVVYRLDENAKTHCQTYEENVGKFLAGLNEFFLHGVNA